ncbi:MAG: LCP family protein [Actinobacteria bacterium]|nr:LCP family protein [Actinomycetota bacterium]
MARSRKSLRRTWPQRLLLATNVVAIVGAVTTASVLGYFNQKVSQVTRLRLGDVLERTEVAPGQPQNYLLVGADDASGLGSQDPETRGRGSITTARSDTIMILRLDPKDTTARLLSLPRDLWVTIPGQSRKNRINTAFTVGGARLLIRTIEQDFGIPVNHYLQVNFAGFKQLVEAIDGVPMYFRRPMRDLYSGLNVRQPGCTLLDPTQALAFARSRFTQYQLPNGRWSRYESVAPDLSRITRQQLFIETAMKRAIRKGVRNPNKLRQLIDVGVRSVQLDERLKSEDIARLGLRFRSFNPSNLKRYSPPVTETVKGVADVLELQVDGAEPIFDLFRGTTTGSGVGSTTAPADVSQVKVRVLNGTGVGGQATESARSLRDAGFGVTSTGDEVGAGTAGTVVRYTPATAAQARLVARYVASSVRFEQRASLAGADVELVTGSDWAGVQATPKAAGTVPGPPTTTSPSTPTSSTTSPEGSAPTTTIQPGYYIPGPPPPGVDCG